MKKIILLVGLINGFLLLTGCATITNGRFQPVTVRTQPPGAACTLSNDKGQWKIASTPATVNVHRSMDDLKISCSKTGYKTALDDDHSDMKKMILGNVLFGGVIGAGIDTANGAGFSYPNIINIELNRNKKN